MRINIEEWFRMMRLSELATLRQLCGISTEDIMNEMNTTKEVVDSVEDDRPHDSMTARFYRLT